MVNKNILISLLIFAIWGGGNCLFGVTDKTTPLFRGNNAIVEVKSLDTNPTVSPNTGVFYSGTLSTTARCFDIICSGKIGTGSSDRVKLDVQPANQIPAFFSKNAAGKIVFATPQVVGTIKAAKGHNSWVKIELKNVNGDLVSDIAEHVCLGIKKNDEDSFFDIIHAENSVSRYVDVTQESYIELIPLLSKNATTRDMGYVAVNPGDEVSFIDITVPTTGEFNFGSVYRVNVSVHDEQWLTDQTCNLDSMYNESWLNCGGMGVGPVTDQSGKVHENQMFAINYNNTLAYSSDGAHWTENGSVKDLYWDAGPVYGNGIWCAVALTSCGVRRSTDGGKTWSGTLANIDARCLNFANGVFMVVADANPGVVYTSPDAEIWTKVGSVKFSSSYPYLILIYGAGKWIFGSWDGCVCQSKDNGKTWEEISESLYQINRESISIPWYGGCYVNGYFYVIRDDGLIARSSDGVEWKKVFSIDNSGTYYGNITYYKNKLWTFGGNGHKYAVGLFNPDGTIESLE